MPLRRATSRAFSTASAVEFEVAPATIGTLPAATSMVMSMTRSHSLRESVGVSPVVPQGTRKSMPDVTCHSTNDRSAASSSAPVLAPGGKVTLAADVTPKPRMHVYSPEQHDYIPVSLQITAPPGVTAGRPVFPKGESFVFAPTKETQIVFSKPFRIDVPLTASRALQPGPIEITGVLQYQACDDEVCYVPRKVEVRWALNLQ